MVCVMWHPNPDDHNRQLQLSPSRLLQPQRILNTRRLKFPVHMQHLQSDIRSHFFDVYSIVQVVFFRIRLSPFFQGHQQNDFFGWGLFDFCYCQSSAVHNQRSCSIDEMRRFDNLPRRWFSRSSANAEAVAERPTACDQGGG